MYHVLKNGCSCSVIEITCFCLIIIISGRHTVSAHRLVGHDENISCLTRRNYNHIYFLWLGVGRIHINNCIFVACDFEKVRTIECNIDYLEKVSFSLFYKKPKCSYINNISYKSIFNKQTNLYNFNT